MLFKREVSPALPFGLSVTAPWAYPRLNSSKTKGFTPLLLGVVVGVAGGWTPARAAKKAFWAGLRTVAGFFVALAPLEWGTEGALGLLYHTKIDQGKQPQWAWSERQGGSDVRLLNIMRLWDSLGSSGGGIVGLLL